MIPVKLTLEGFLSYRTRAEADLSQVKVACVSGANGAGKSTLFDAITWALFGKARRNDDALINNKVDRCQVIFEFIYENNRYRVERAKPRGKGTELEFYIQAEDSSWKPLTEAGVRATEERIRDVLRLDYDTFINASFFLQGKADMFAIQPPARRKEILSSILGLEIWDSYRDEAAKRRRETQSEKKTQQYFLEDIIKELDEEEIRRKNLAQKEAELADKTALRETNQQLLSQARLMETQLQNDVDKLNLMKKQAAGFENQLNENRRLLDERQKESSDNALILSEEMTIQNAHARYQKLKEELRNLDAISEKYHDITVKKMSLESEIRTKQARLEQEESGLEKEAAEIEEIQSSLPHIEKALNEKESKLTALKMEMEKIPSLEKEATDLKSKHADLKAENNRLNEEMQKLKKRKDQLQAASGTQCPLCEQPLTGDHKQRVLAELESEGKVKGDQYRANVALMERYEKDFESINNEIEKLNALQSNLSQLAASVAVLQKEKEENVHTINNWQTEGRKRFAELQESLKNGKAAEKEKIEATALQKQLDALAYSPEKHNELRKQEADMQDIENKYRKLDSARTAQAGLNREIMELQKQNQKLEQDLEDVHRIISDLELELGKKEASVPDIKELESRIGEIQREENSLRSDVGAARQLVDVLEAQRKRKKDIEAEIQAISQKIARLKMLETAFGRDGIPALLIEQAIPLIEIQANDILDKLTNGDMSVNFETEREYADKNREDKKQTLDIMISDSAGTRAYELFSGGEAFRINFAIRLALSRMLAHRSGARLQTLVIDEGFGSQDAEGRQRLIEAINLVSEDFAKILVITHLDELKDVFSSRIEVTKTSAGSQIEVIA